MSELRRTLLKKAFQEYMPLPQSLEPHLKEALTRVLSNPGSLIRPEMVFEVALGYDLPQSTATGLAIGLEYFHTASLLFDDLPSMDDALERRGAPSLHVEFGDAGAILSALALVNRAYALTWQAVATCPAELQSRALAYVEHHLGVGGLLNGQSMDLHYASLPRNARTTELTAISKTVSLIRLTLVLPALLGGAPEAEVQMLERISLLWGLSYQIVDDLKDVLQSSDESGKTSSRDLSLGRPNIALAMGVEEAVNRLTRLIDLGDRMLQRLLVSRPTLGFLQTLRAKLGEEAFELTQSACDETVGGRV
jgi:geranylgeranyl diphosphate synthase type II